MNEVPQPAHAVRAIVERLAETLRLDSGDPVLPLFGQGTADEFACSDYQVRPLDQALWCHLRAAGYERIVFSSAAEQLYYLDPESHARSRPEGAAPASGTRRPGRMARFTGPQGDLVQFHRDGGEGSAGPAGSSTARDQAQARGSAPSGMGDPFLIQTLHAYMREPRIRTAVVVLRAEQFLTFVRAERELAERVGDWTQARGSDVNVCVLVFSSDTLEEVVTAVRDQGRMSTLAAYLGRWVAQGRGGRVGPPGRAELDRLANVMRVRPERPLRIADWSGYDRTVDTVAAQGEALGTWSRRFNLLAHLDEPLSLPALARRDWLRVEADVRSVEEQLHDLVGLAPVKEYVSSLKALALSDADARRSGRRPGDREPRTLHLVFTGNPGTGKTTIARVIGQLYRELGLLRRGHVVEAEESDLVADHVGGTAIKVAGVVERALDGVLLIDEAYRLTAPERGGFGAQAVEALLTRMENHRDRLVVVAAGYTEPMRGFIAANPGLRRRFPPGNEIEFPDYTPPELTQILFAMIARRGYRVDPELATVLRRVVEKLYEQRDETFGNAGEMRNIVDELERNWATRVYGVGGGAPGGLGADEPFRRVDLPERLRRLLE